MKNTHDYDSTFKTLKNRHTRLFIAVINLAFQKNYPLNAEVRIISSEGAFIDEAKPDDKSKVEMRENDFLISINDDYYMIEAQSYDDNEMALRIAEYTFLAARSVAVYDQGHIIMPMPNYTIIYIKNSARTPKTTMITYRFPDGRINNYSTENIFMTDLSREDIIEKKLYVLIPFYFARYEKELKGKNITEKDIEKVIEDLEFFSNEMLQLSKEKELTMTEADEIRYCVNDVLLHITDGNNIEGKVVSVMGGEIYELHTERIIRETTERVTAEFEERLADREKQLADREKQLVDKDKRLADKDKRLAELEEEIARLKADNKTA